MPYNHEELMCPELSVSEVCIAVGDSAVPTKDVLLDSCKMDRCHRIPEVNGTILSTTGSHNGTFNDIERGINDDDGSQYDLNSETIQNTRINENMTPRRELRRSSLKSGIRRKSTTTSVDSPRKRVNFVDESHSNHVLAGYKATLHNPNVSEEARNHAREILLFHNEL